MMSIWMRSAPAASASRTCSPRRVKSADKMDGTIPIILFLALCQFTCRPLIQHPYHLALCRSDNLRGVFVGVIRTLQNGLDGVSLFGTGNEEEDVAGGVQDGWREGQARWWRLGNDDGHHQSPLLVQGSLMWEERGSMAFRPHAELN